MFRNYSTFQEKKKTKTETILNHTCNRIQNTKYCMYNILYDDKTKFTLKRNFEYLRTVHMNLWPLLFNFLIPWFRVTEIIACIILYSIHSHK
ncbi:unnamed protein product [Rhizophagus irregularis]|nr:unnamed protein product [Rhizophagus irregularis]